MTFVGKCWKIRYPSREAAWDAALHFFIAIGTYSTPYKCWNCKKFHLTAKKATPIPSQAFVDGFNEWFGRKVLPDSK